MAIQIESNPNNDWMEGKTAKEIEVINKLETELNLMTDEEKEEVFPYLDETPVTSAVTLAAMKDGNNEKGQAFLKMAVVSLAKLEQPDNSAPEREWTVGKTTEEITAIDAMEEAMGYGFDHNTPFRVIDGKMYTYGDALTAIKTGTDDISFLFRKSAVIADKAMNKIVTEFAFGNTSKLNWR